MNDHFQAPPPSYAEVENRYVAPDRAQGYSVLPQQATDGDVKFSPAGSAPPMSYGVQVVPLVTFGQSPIQCVCSKCRASIVTRTLETTGILAWLVCFLCCVFGCWLGCCLIPFCISDLQNVKHFCPNCNAPLGEYRPL